MPHNPAAGPPQDESLGELVAQASDQISTLIRAEIELAKAELRFDAKRVGTASGLFAAAAFIGHLVLILASFTIAYWLVAAGLSQALAFTIVTVFYILAALVLVLFGWRRLKGLTKMQRTTRTLKHLKGGSDELDSLGAAKLPEGAGEIGARRESVTDGR
ncbi:phage holin family protein [Spongiactinospora gelatinilytica]|uniref:Phage holin family protein n=1 Tax=Spongiactinospora gelatinilytica TaxID=2666298 RepID=A0A2W2HWC6_9ACTN|nr:phage holin family protein [Spongiactinospora gelatinilytica]PZG42904.1 phage holin family protein [Spongiactinospora gelatinilytica]